MGEGALWQAYRSGQDLSTRDRILSSHLGLVHHVAKRLKRRLTSQVEYRDLLGSGTIGLMQAIESYDPRRGIAFSTFAVPRIRGAILDELRRRDHVPRSTREKQSALRDAAEELRQNLGGEPSPCELAAALGLDPERLQAWRTEVRTTEIVSLDRPARRPSDDVPGELAAVIPSEETSAEERLERAELVDRIAAVLETLPERERLVLTLYYYEDLKLREIGELLGVTESRISQIHSAALDKLRRDLTRPAPSNGGPGLATP